MSRKATKRRHYALINPIQHAIDGACVTPEHLLGKIETRELSAIDTFARGRATIQEWYDIASLVGMCQTMASDGIGPEALDTCLLADNAIDEAMIRFKKSGKMGTTGPGLQAFRDLMEYHQLQRRLVSRSHYEKITAKVIAKVRQMRGEMTRWKASVPATGE